MDLPVTPHSTVAHVLDASPRAVGVFLRLKTGCAGCRLARFCTIRDVARSYQLETEAILAALREIHTEHEERSEP